MKIRFITIIVLVLIVGIVVVNILNQGTPPNNSSDDNLVVIPIDRESLIPENKTKRTPETDQYPPILHSSLWEEPIPLPYPINTAGAEDSPFMDSCGCNFYFVYTPDVDVPIQEQLVDGVTGLWCSKRTIDGWMDPVKVETSNDDTLDGCPFIHEKVLWFCSARPGYIGVHFFIADLNNSDVSNVRYADERLNDEIVVGELHLTTDGKDLYYHAPRLGGSDMDIWVTHFLNGTWSDPESVEAVNTLDPEGMPFVTSDGGELWFNRQYKGSPAIYRSFKVEGEWTEPELIISQFAGEPNLDEAGNIYFVHHFYENGTMIEADIYVAYKKETIPIYEPKIFVPFDNPDLPERGFFMGYLPIPYEGQSFDEVYQITSERAEIVPVWGKPSSFYEMPEVLAGNWGNIFIDNLIRGNNLAPLIHMSFIDVGMTLKVPPGMEGATLNDSKFREHYIEAAVNIVNISRPKFLSLGNEVNRWYEEYGLEGNNSFLNWISLYENAYKAVKALSPETIVFCTFSREMVSNSREADLSILELFDPDTLDMLIFTSYPNAVSTINRPSDIPDNYYKIALDFIPDKAFGFSEISWPSMEEFGGETSQAQFLTDAVSRLTLSNGIDLKLFMWSWNTDLEGDTSGLITIEGNEKQALELWETYYSWGED